MEKEPKDEISTEHLKNFIEVYSLFNHNEIRRLLTNNKVNINFNTKSLGSHGYLNFKPDDIFYYVTENGKEIKIKITDFNITPEDSNNKKYYKGNATFEII